MYNFLKDIPDDQLVLIQGNHEYLYTELLKKPYPQQYDFNNGTVKTFLNIAYGTEYSDSLSESFFYEGLSEMSSTLRKCYTQFKDDPMTEWKKVIQKVKRSSITKWLTSNKWRNYYEVDNYIFVHSFIPLNDASDTNPYYLHGHKFCYNPNWRELSTDKEIYTSTWGCPWQLFKEGFFDEEIKNNKRLVVGHWTTSDFFVNLDDSPEDAYNYKIYYGKNIIALDGGVHGSWYGLVHDQNVLVIKDNKCYDKYGKELSYEKVIKELEYPNIDAEEDYLVTDASANVTICASDCQTKCKRRARQVGYYTAAEFAPVCRSYSKLKSK